MPVSRIGVVGCGLTGSGIVEVCARSGLDVNVAERGEEALAAGRSRVVTSLDRGLRSGKLSESERQGGSTGSRSRLALRTLPEAARPDIAPAALGHGGAVLGADVAFGVGELDAGAADGCAPAPRRERVHRSMAGTRLFLPAAETDRHDHVTLQPPVRRRWHSRTFAQRCYGEASEGFGVFAGEVIAGATRNSVFLIVC